MSTKAPLKGSYNEPAPLREEVPITYPDFIFTLNKGGQDSPIFEFTVEDLKGKLLKKVQLDMRKTLVPGTGFEVTGRNYGFEMLPKRGVYETVHVYRDTHNIFPHPSR